MAKSWGHKIVPLTPEDARYYAERYSSPDRWVRHTATCSHPGCPHIVEVKYIYQYVTGSKGRETWACYRLCEEHAKQRMARELEKAKQWPSHQQA